MLVALEPAHSRVAQALMERQIRFLLAGPVGQPHKSLIKQFPTRKPDRWPVGVLRQLSDVSRQAPHA